MFNKGFSVQRMGKVELKTVCMASLVFVKKFAKERFPTIIFFPHYFSDEKSKNEKTLNETEFTNRCSVLKRYVDANIDREKQVLYALQHLMHTLEHPNSKSFFKTYSKKSSKIQTLLFFQNCCSISSMPCTTMMWYRKKALKPGLRARIQQSRKARAWLPNLPPISSRGCAKTMTMKAKTKSEKN